LGLGYLIVDAYMNNVTVPMVIAMITLGSLATLALPVCGPWVTSLWLGTLKS